MESFVNNFNEQYEQLPKILKLLVISTQALSQEYKLRLRFKKKNHYGLSSDEWTDVVAQM